VHRFDIAGAGAALEPIESLLRIARYSNSTLDETADQIFRVGISLGRRRLRPAHCGADIAFDPAASQISESQCDCAFASPRSARAVSNLTGSALAIWAALRSVIFARAACRKAAPPLKPIPQR